MKGKLVLGVLILVVGLIAGIYGLIGPGQRTEVREGVIVGDQNQPERDEAATILIPVIAGVSIAAGAALIGIGMGAFRRPKIVPPDSPEAHKAATTTGTTP